MSRFALDFATFALVLVMSATPALADTYTVNTTADADDATPGDNTCATAAGKCSLRAAVHEANAHGGADMIVVPAGVFRLTIAGPGEDAAATGDLDVTESLTVTGAGIDDTTIDGIGSDRIFDLKAGVSFTARDLSMRNGIGSPAGGAVAQLATGTTTLERVGLSANASNAGGGLVQVAGALTLTDCVIENNVAMDGAGVYFAGTGPLVITGTTVSGNNTLGGDGAGVYDVSTGAISVTGSTFSDNTADGTGGSLVAPTAASATLADSTFSNNTALGSIGGPACISAGAVTVTNVKALNNFAQVMAGAYLGSMTTIQVSGSEFSDNFSLGSATNLVIGTNGVTLTDLVARRNAVYGGGTGGGLTVQSTGGGITATNLELTENSAQQGGGGYMMATGAITITGAKVLNNGAPMIGGLYVQAGTTLSVTDSTVDGNAAVQLAGAYFVGASGLSLSNSTISNNRADNPAGIYGGAYVASPAPSTVTNVTFSGNAATMGGGGIYTGGSMTIRNATFVNNEGAMGSAIVNGGGTLNVVSTIIAGGANHCFGPITSGGNNIDQGGSCAFAGSGDLTSDPQLGPLANNGGPTLTHLPAPTSPAIDAGAASGCPGADQRGQTRPSDGNADGTAVCDVGAVEFIDNCPNDPAKTLPGICGCGVADTDADQANGTADCLVNGELKARIARAKTLSAGLASDNDPTETELSTIGASFVPYVKAHTDIQVANAKPKLAKLAKKAFKAVKKVCKAKAAKLGAAKTKAATALDAFDADVMPQS